MAVRNWQRVQSFAIVARSKGAQSLQTANRKLPTDYIGSINFHSSILFSGRNFTLIVFAPFSRSWTWCSSREPGSTNVPSLGGRWCIGTDSHIGIDPLEELRMIDYRQRLLTNKRNTFEGDAAQYMISEALLRGRLAMGRRSLDFFEVGQPFDAVVYDAASPRLAGDDTHGHAPSIVYHTGASRLGTIVNGKWVTVNNHHIREEEIRTKYLHAMKVITEV